MKTISPQLKNHLTSEVTTLATCWKITRRDATVLGFTSHSAALIIDAIIYEAATGFTPSAIANSADLAVDNLEIEGMLSSDAIAEEDILAGLYDFAEIDIFQVNYADLSQGKLILRRGWLGEVRFSKSHFTAEVRGLTQRLAKTLGELYSPSCRAKLGDTRCKKLLGSFTISGATVDSASDRQHFSDAALTQIAGYFNYGVVTFTSGANAGLSMEVKEYTPGKVTLVLPMPYTISAGDNYTIIAGCDKSFDTCVAKFNNAINFRGEPHVPGIDKLFQTSTTRGSE